MLRWKPVVSALAVFVVIGGSLTGAAGASTGGATTRTERGLIPAWAGYHGQLSSSADAVARILTRSAVGGRAAVNRKNVPQCPAERSRSGNVMVTCLAQDGQNPNNTQAETTVAAHGRTVVVAYNDTNVCCDPIEFVGYSVSHDYGRSFVDMGSLPTRPDNQSVGDPAVAAGSDGSFYLTTVALTGQTAVDHSVVSFYRMAPGQSRFELMSGAVDAGSLATGLADKDYLAIGTDGNGHQHFYVTWTLIQSTGALMLTDSTDGVHWSTHPVSDPSQCSSLSNPVPAGATVYVSWEQQVCDIRPSTHGTAMMAALDVATGQVLRRTQIAPTLGGGDAIVNCNGPNDFREVIETGPGEDNRTNEMPTTTIDANGVLYAAWNDRPSGVGGSPSNATRIYLSYSLDGDKSWSTPQAISGPVSSRIVRDRFFPWITAGGGALHAMWYQRVGNLIQTDAEELSLATASAGPHPSPEVRVSIVQFPLIQNNPHQDPDLSNCSVLGDYNNIVYDDGTSYITWADTRNVLKTTQGREHQPDVFLARRY